MQLLCWLTFVLIVASAITLLSGCEYVRLLRPSVLKQLNPDVARMVNELPNVDRQNEEIIGRLFVHGGLSHAKEGQDGVMRDEIRIPEDQLIWKPAIIVMPHAGELEIEYVPEPRRVYGLVERLSA